jgi:hypothetical protein
MVDVLNPGSIPTQNFGFAPDYRLRHQRINLEDEALMHDCLTVSSKQWITISTSLITLPGEKAN